MSPMSAQRPLGRNWSLGGGQVGFGMSSVSWLPLRSKGNIPLASALPLSRYFLYISFRSLMENLVGGQAFGLTWLLAHLSAQAKSLLSVDHEMVVCITFDLRFGFQIAMGLGYNERRVRMMDCDNSGV